MLRAHVKVQEAFECWQTGSGGAAVGTELFLAYPYCIQLVSKLAFLNVRFLGMKTLDVSMARHDTASAVIDGNHCILTNFIALASQLQRLAVLLPFIACMATLNYAHCKTSSSAKHWKYPHFPPTSLVLTRTILWSALDVVNVRQQMENDIKERQGDEFYLPVQMGGLILYDSLDLVPWIQ